MTTNGTQEVTEKTAFSITPEQQIEVLNNIFKALNALNISGDQSERLTGIKQGLVFVTKAIAEDAKKVAVKPEEK